MKQDQFHVLLKKREYVFLGKNGTDIIQDNSYQKGISTLIAFKQLIQENKVTNVKLLGTAALRRASNGDAFKAEVKQKTGFDIEVIDGKREAELIFKGTILAKATDDKKHLIMDIGGGSVEFIVFQNKSLLWSKSFRLGISLLHPIFQIHDPLTTEDKNALNVHLEKELKPLAQQLENHKIEYLIGASGSFEVLEQMSKLSPSPKGNLISLDVFKALYNMIINANEEQRLQMKRLDPNRAVLAQIAFYLINYVLGLSNAKQIFVSPYALKEGVISEMINKNSDYFPLAGSSSGSV